MGCYFARTENEIPVYLYLTQELVIKNLYSMEDSHTQQLRQVKYYQIIITFGNNLII